MKEEMQLEEDSQIEEEIQLKKDIRLKDFARERGVSERAIQKHIQRHAKELGNHVERKGPNGTWLDIVACNMIKEWMIHRNEIIIADTNTVNENEEQKKEIKELNDKLYQANLLIQSLYDANSKLMEEKARLEGTQLLLVAAQDQIQTMERREQDTQDKLVEMAREAERASQEKQIAQERALAAESKIEELKSRTFWERLTRKGE